MVQTRGEADLLLETRDDFAVFRQAHIQDLDRHFAFKRMIPGSEYPARGAPSDLTQQGVPAVDQLRVRICGHQEWERTPKRWR